MWLTESPFVRYNGGRIFWRRAVYALFPPSGQGGFIADRSPAGAVVGPGKPA